MVSLLAATLQDPRYIFATLHEPCYKASVLRRGQALQAGVHQGTQNVVLSQTTCLSAAAMIQVLLYRAPGGLYKEARPSEQYPGD